MTKSQRGKGDKRRQNETKGGKKEAKRRQEKDTKGCSPHPFVARPCCPRFADCRRPKTRHRCRSRHLIRQKDRHEPHTHTRVDGTKTKVPQSKNIMDIYREPIKTNKKRVQNVTNQNQPRNHCCRCPFCSRRSGWWFWTLTSISAGHSPLLPGAGLEVRG